MLSPDAEQARKAYDSFVRDGIGEGKRSEFRSGNCEGRILGSVSFTDEILSNVDQKAKKISLSEVIAKACIHFKISEELRNIHIRNFNLTPEPSYVRRNLETMPVCFRAAALVSKHLV